MKNGPTLKTLWASQLIGTVSWLLALSLGPDLLAKTTKNSQDIFFLCENTRQINGAYDEIAPAQKIKIPSPKIFNKFYSLTTKDNNFQILTNSKWYMKGEDYQYVVDLKKLEKKLNILTKADHNIWINFELTNNSSKMNIAPIFYRKKEGEHSLPDVQVFFYNENTPYYKSLGLPKNAHYILNGPIYKEFNYNYGMINRIARTINSAYLYDAISCGVKHDEYFEINYKANEFQDITENLSMWPEELKDLKQSIGQIIFDHYFRENSNFSLSDYKEIFENINLSKLPLNSTINLTTAQETKLKEMAIFISKTHAKKEDLPYQKVFRFFNRSKIKGEIIATLPLDKSKEANTFKSYNPNKYLDLNLIDQVSITKVKAESINSNTLGNDQYYFYFHGTGEMKNHHIGIGPIDFEKIYWKKSNTSFNMCTEKVMKHANEYERKAFLFSLSNESYIENEEDLLNLFQYHKYPLEEFILTNNCRGAGNFEYEWPGIIKGYFQIPPAIMAKIVDSISNKSAFKFSDLKTEVRLTSFYDKLDTPKLWPDSIKNLGLYAWSKLKEKRYQWYRFDDWDEAVKDCKAQEITDNLISSKTETSHVKLRYEMGEIYYGEFLGETRKKSGHLGEDDALVYTKTPCTKEEVKKEIPFTLRPSRRDIVTPIKTYWEKMTCEIIPHRFYSYEDLTKFPVYLSKFEVDGVYTGQSHTSNQYEMSKHDIALLKDDKARILFDFKNAYSFKDVEIIEDEEYITFNLKSVDQKFNLVLGNIPKHKLTGLYNRDEFESYVRPWANDHFRSVYSLIGINPFNLANFYDSSISPMEKPIFSYFYDDKGRILNHHDPKIGIEQWYVKKTYQGYQIDLLSHERITPVARIYIGNNY